VPSPYTRQSGLGLRFHHIRDGIFESGTTRTNPIEAKAVAQAIIDHPVSPLENLIAEGEHERLEFKQTLRWDIRQATVNKKLEDVVVKTIAAFANHKGGTLLIGVRDDGGIEGLEPDFNCTGGRDKFDLHLTNLINSRFSQSFRAANAIRLRRRSLNLSQEQLAVACGISFQQIQKYENGSNRVSFSRLVQIARALECRVSDLTDALDDDGPVAPTEFAFLQLMTLPGAVDLLTEYQRMAPEARRHLVELLQNMRREPA
jgi:transcriptional regulator with XRE-family HTH domain